MPVGPMRWNAERLAQFQRDGEERRKSKGAAPTVERRVTERRSKYKSKTIVINGERFDSEKEVRRWATLRMMQEAGQISDLRRQVPFELAPAVMLRGAKRKKPALRYYADAVYIQDGAQVIEDTKSEITRKLPAYRIKLHLMKTVLGLDIHEV